jgi:SAM-dependent MidA family methyltransferase
VTPLGREIAALIASEGPIGIDRYMALCLGHPRHGYYMTRDPLGASGDFTTAPEISQVFGELIGLWLAQVWIDMGGPPAAQLVELGPGRGTLMLDLLRAAKVAPGFRNALAVDLVETSPPLRAAQERTLASAGRPIRWLDSLDQALDAADGRPLLLVANEFLDALPIRQFQRVGDGWRERLVGFDGDRLAPGLAAEPEAMRTRNAPEGAIAEVSPAGLAVVAGVARAIAARGGAALFIDYGHAGGGFGDTFQAVRKHAHVDPFAEPGEADLTAHVNFTAMATAGARAGAVVHGPLTQGAFLARLGAVERTEQLSAKARDEATRADLVARCARLMQGGDAGLGELFKVLALTGPGQQVPPAFGDKV